MVKSYRIFIYCRVSTEEQAENPEGSIKNQEQRLREYVRFRNQDGHFGEIVEVLIDAGISAKDMNRPALQKLLKKIAKKEVDLVMVTDLSRFTRSTKDFSNLWEFMQRHGCKFQSLRENFDSTTAAGEMIMFTLANFAQFERKQTAERISAAFLARAKRGLYNGGSIPLGFRSVVDKPGLLEIVEEEADLVREVFQTFLKEQTLSLTAKALNKKGLKAKRRVLGGGHIRSGFFHTDTVHKILKNKAYIGVRQFNEKGVTKETKSNWPGIVDEVIFNRVQVILAKNKSARKPPSNDRYPYLLSGISFCKSCGDRMAGKSAHGTGGKIAYYEHSWSTKAGSVLSKKLLHCDPPRILAKLIEPVVWEEVKKFLTCKEIAEELIQKAKKQIDPNSKPKEIEKIKGKASGLKFQTESLAERLAQLPKGLDAKPIFDQMAKLQSLAAEYENQIKELQSQMGEEQVVVNTSDLAAFRESISELLRLEANPIVRSQIIHKVVAKILITPTGIEIHFHLGQNHFKREIDIADSNYGGTSKNQFIGSSVGPQEGVILEFRKRSKPLEKYLGRNALEGHKNITDTSSNSLTNGGLYWTRTSDLSHVKGTRYQLRQETINRILKKYQSKT